MEMSDWLEAIIFGKVVLRCATKETGEQCAIISGEWQMQLWCAGNLDTPVQVLL